MKKWIWLGALLLLLLPHQGTEVGALLPVETLLIEKKAGQYRVSTDMGGTAQGNTLKAAIDTLRAEAPGILFLDTADYVLLTPETSECLKELANYVRPGTRVYELTGAADITEVGDILRAHGPDAPLYRLEKGAPGLPKLWAVGDDLHFEGQ